MSQQLPAHLAVLITTYSTHRCELSKSFQFAILAFLSHVLAHEEILLACQRTSSTSFRLDLSTCRSLFRILSGLASFQRQRWAIAISDGFSLQMLSQVELLPLMQVLKTHLGQLVFTSVNRPQVLWAVLPDQSMQFERILLPSTPLFASSLGITSISTFYWCSLHAVVGCYCLHHGRCRPILLALRTPIAKDPPSLSVCLALLIHHLHFIYRPFEFEYAPSVAMQ